MSCWHDHLILQVRAGSRAYGLEGPASDHDSRGVCVPDKEALIGLQTFEQWQSESGDHVVFGLPKFVRLALEGNPNLIETLWTEDLLHVDRFGQRLLEARDLFLSRRVAERFGSYALHQLRRLENHQRWWVAPPSEPDWRDFGARPGPRGSPVFPNSGQKRAFEQAHKNWSHFLRWKRERNPQRAELEERHGYDTKHAMHLCRLLRMGQEILRDGQVLVRRPDAEWLRGVRAGSLSFEELLEWARAAEAELGRLRDLSPLPEQPDEARAERLLMSLLEDFYWPNPPAASTA